MKTQNYFIITVVITLLALTTSCSNYTRADNPSWFSIDYPKGFEYTISPDSMGNTPEIDIYKNISISLKDNNKQITANV
jgi:hypothetical protein